MKFTDLAVSFRELCEPRHLRLSDAAKALHTAMKAWAADQQTDGVVPDVALQLIPGGHNASAIAELVDSGLWSPKDHGFETDWTGQILAADAREITERNRKNWSGLKRHQRGKHGIWCPKSCSKSSTDAAGDSAGDPARDRAVDARAESSAYVPNLTGPDRTDPSGIGEVRSGERRSGARLVEAAALAPPPHDRAHRQGFGADEALALIDALRAGHIDEQSPPTKEQKTLLKALLPDASSMAPEILVVLRFALPFDGDRLRDVDAGVGAAIIAASEQLGAAGFASLWLDAARNIRAIRQPKGAAERDVDSNGS